MRGWYALGAVLVVGGAAVVLSRDPPGTYQQLPNGVTPQMVEEGEEIYHGEGLCSVCHGAEGSGGAIGPDLTDQEWLHGDGSYAYLVRRINEGVSQPRQAAATMPPRGGSSISQDQVRAVAAYVWSLSRGS